jgi:hypothetical protein
MQPVVIAAAESGSVGNWQSGLTRGEAKQAISGSGTLGVAMDNLYESG